MKETKLNIICGTDTRTGFVNLGRVKLQSVYFVHDLNKFQLAYEMFLAYIFSLREINFGLIVAK